MRFYFLDAVCRYYEVKLTSEKTTVQEETVQVNTEDDRRRKDGEKQSREVITSDSDDKTKNVHGLLQIRRDDAEERSFVQKSVVTTESSSSESFREKNVREEPAKEWSQRSRDESDSTHQTAGGGGYSSTTEESWALRSGRSTKRDMSTVLRIHERTGVISPSPASPSSPSFPLQGGVRCQAVDSEHLSIRSHEEKRRFYISAVIDPRTGLHLSIREVITFEYLTKA